MGGNTLKGALIGGTALALAPLTGGASLGAAAALGLGGAAIGGAVGASKDAAVLKKASEATTPATPNPTTPTTPPPALAAPTIADPAAQQAGQDAITAAKKYRGRAATILSGGTTGEDISGGIAAKKLLGG
jgi:hypothetical protein